MVSGTLSASSTKSVSIRATCSGANPQTVAIHNVSFQTYDAVPGANPLVPQPTEPLRNLRFTENGTVAPWVFPGQGDTTMYSSSVTDGSWTIALIDKQGNVAGGGSSVFQDVALFERGQTWAVKAVMSTSANTNNNAQRVCRHSLSLDSNILWNSGDVTSPQTINVDARGTLVQDGKTFRWSFACTPWDKATPISFTLSNVGLIMNV